MKTIREEIEELKSNLKLLNACSQSVAVAEGLTEEDIADICSAIVADYDYVCRDDMMSYVDENCVHPDCMNDWMWDWWNENYNDLLQQISDSLE